MTSTPSSAPRQPQGMNWVQTNGFILGLLAAVALAFAFPAPGSRHGWMHPSAVANVGIALILFLQGLSIPLEKIKGSAGNWKLHVIIQSFTFLVFPLVGLAFQSVLTTIWPGEPLGIRSGLLFLCVLPSTVSTSVVLTAVAGGNTAAAVLSAAMSNLMGVVLTPLLVSFLMQATGEHGAVGPLILQIALLTVLPFIVGGLLRPRVRVWIEANKRWSMRLSNTVILFIVYTAFCDSVTERIWATYGATLTIKVVAIIVALFVTVSLLAYGASRAARLNREDAIAAYFCAVKKTLAMGVPLAMLIFGKRSDLGLILLPLMFYHPLQLFANGLLANLLAKRQPPAEMA